MGPLTQRDDRPSSSSGLNLSAFVDQQTHLDSGVTTTQRVTSVLKSTADDIKSRSRAATQQDGMRVHHHHAAGQEMSQESAGVNFATKDDEVQRQIIASRVENNAKEDENE